MASRVEFAVSATPVATVDAGENVAVDTIAADVKKSLGGSASVTTTHNSTGFGSGAAAYGNAAVSGGSALTLGSAGYDFVFIKNTGKKYSSATALGDDTTASLKVTLGSQEACTIPAGGAIVLPTVPAVAVKVQSAAASDTIAVEYLLST